MAETLATVDELQERLDFVLDDGEQGVAQGALDDLSDDARFYGDASWNSNNAPRQAKSLVLRAAARFMRNPDGLTQSRAGDETLAWADQGERAGTTYFTKVEQKMLEALAGKQSSGLYSVPVQVYGTTPRYGYGGDNTIYVPTEGKPFPFYDEGVHY